MMSLSKAYFIFNILVVFIIITIFSYSCIVTNNGLKVNCSHKIENGKDCNTCGITRGLNSFMNCNFSEARFFNSYSVFFGMYLCIYGFARIIFAFIIKQKLFFFSIKRVIIIEFLFGIITLIILYQFKN